MSEPERPAAFELQQAGRHFSRYAVLRSIALRIEAGERVALLGPSGAGKSTLLSLLNGSLAPSTGTARAFGRDWAALSPRQLRRLQRHIGTVHQPLQLVGSLRAVHNINAGHLGRWPFWKAALSLAYPLQVEAAQQVLAQLQLPEVLGTRTDRLSGGQQQRVAIARVLVQDPSAILADEPIASLDPALSHTVMALLRAASERTGKTLVASLHSLAFARQYCDRAVGLRAGEIAFDCPIARLSPEALSALYRLPG